jgi:hypothetical protein
MARFVAAARVRYYFASRATPLRRGSVRQPTTDMKTLHLERPRQLYISLPAAFAIIFFGFAAVIAHSDSPHSWLCIVEYIGLPGLVLAYGIGEDLPIQYAEVVLFGMAAVSFLAWAWLIDRWLSRRRKHREAHAAA